MVTDEERWARSAYAAHGPELFRLSYRLLGDRGLAEEVVQDTFVRAWRRLDSFDDEIASLRTWLFAICRNVVIDASRARSVRPAQAEAVRADVADLGAEVDRVLTAWQLDEALRRLRDEHRHAVIEIVYRRRPYGDVATDLDVPVGTLKSRVYYGLRALRLALEELGWSD